MRCLVPWQFESSIWRRKGSSRAVRMHRRGCLEVESLESRLTPSISISATTPISEGQSTLLSGTITDPPSSPFDVPVNWGDGTTSTLSLEAGSTSFSTSHVYTDNSPVGTPYDIIGSLPGTAPMFRSAFSMGSSSDEGAGAVRSDPSGNIYVVGSYSGTFSPGSGVTLTNAGSYDGFVAKYDSSDQLLWAASLSGSGVDQCEDVAVDSSGNVYVTGMFTGQVDFDPGSATSYLTSAGGSQDEFVWKLNSAGNFVWAKSIGSTGIENGLGIGLDGSSNVYITGGFSGTVNFDSGGSNTTLTSSGTLDPDVLKLDANGAFQWVRNVAGASVGNAWKVATDSADNVYVTGTVNQLGDADANFDPGHSNYTLHGYYFAFVWKMDTSGNFQWAHQVNSPGQEQGIGIAVDNSGNVLATGTLDGTADFDPGTGTYNLASAGGNDGYIWKLDTDGNLVWARRFGGTGYDGGSAPAFDSAGNAYTAMWYSRTADFGPGPGAFSVTSAGGIDILFMKQDGAGNVLWYRQVGGSGYDAPAQHNIAIDGSGNLCYFGQFDDTADFDPGSGTYNLSSGGGLDVFVARWAQAETGTTQITVDNVAPTASLSGPTDGFQGVRSQVRTFTLGAAAPSTADQDAGFTYSLDWGDGNTETVSGLTGTQRSHAYNGAGDYVVTMTATDKDGGVSAPVTLPLHIGVTEQQGATLAIGGTGDGDVIACTASLTSGKLKVEVNGVLQGTFTDSCANSATFVSIKGWRVNSSIGLSGNGDGFRPSSWTAWAGRKSILPRPWG